MPQQSTNRSSNRRPGPPVRRVGAPTWSCPLILLLALIVGTVISIDQQQISGAYLWLFAVTSLACTLFVVPRGLWLTVSSVPLLFGAATPVAAWTIARSSAAEGSDAFSATGIATAIYPLAQHFPVLAATTVGCVLIAVLRLTRVRQLQITAERNHRQVRRQISDAEERNISTASRARRVSSRARREKVEGDTRPTVAELRRKTLEEEAARRRAARPAPGDPRSGGGQRVRRRPVDDRRRSTAEHATDHPSGRSRLRRPEQDLDVTPRARRVSRPGEPVQPGNTRAEAGRPTPAPGVRHPRPEVRRDRYSVGEPARGRVRDPRDQRQREDSSAYPRAPRRRPVSEPQRPRGERNPTGNDVAPEVPLSGRVRDNAPRRSPTPENTPQKPSKPRHRWLDDDLYS
ncbi:hypothetical protein OS125_04095 [Corynebacterium sp. P7003]|uniref:DUF6542 domain-containing protein n=1 Tax=Corynebacterium pygosceleis TaxID=2800406 RepID=A0ABT3WUH6_9CORY|nr:DUF6542 domain-containing protein [Corynebacterium pygosceleis]MCX7444427.1 hypothetical protein [Corynebacterium pygosceleis]